MLGEKHVCYLCALQPTANIVFSSCQMSPRAVKRRLAQHVEKSKGSPMASPALSASQALRKQAVENIVMTSAVICDARKVASMHKSPSKVTINRVRKETEPASDPPTIHRKITWKNFHRWVEQTPSEPLRKSCLSLPWHIGSAG